MTNKTIDLDGGHGTIKSFFPERINRSWAIVKNDIGE